MNLELSKTFDHNKYEKYINNIWAKQQDNCSENNKTFSMIMPPPNITGKLHMGHALDTIMQDIIIRFKRLCGYKTYWIPGIDHAGIATQSKIETYLIDKFNKTKKDITKEEFLKYAWQWKDTYSNKIFDQQKRLGLLCNWEKQRFTLDEHYSLAVTKAFNILYKKKLIYKDKKIINWCTHCLTAISDIEVINKEKNDYLWYISYDIVDNNNKIVIATTRPETIFGDVAIAVNPTDIRYKKLIGKFALIPIINKKIPIISDISIDKTFGTGCVKITPCHDHNDFEIAKNHNLEHISLFDKYGLLNNNNITPKKYIGLKKEQALLSIINDLTIENKIIKKQNYKKNISVCYRCATEIELIESEQWFVKMEFFINQAISLIDEKKIKFIPEHFAKTYINWMSNVHDWCISRQLWWGHQIPAYYCENCNNIFVSENKIKICEKCLSTKIKQDEDVLDTWFSSALFPMVAFGWPEIEQTKFPINVLVTGYDIIFFWVARMIFMSLTLINQIPFKNVLVHGIIRDQYGKKMSKFTGNGVDPIEVIDKYGNDTLRFTLINNTSSGNDMQFDYNKIISSRNFINKIWNIMNFIKLNYSKEVYSINIENFDIKDNLYIEDKWIINKYNKLLTLITKNLKNFEFGNAAANLYNFIYNKFCNIYMEIIKIKLKNQKNNNENFMTMIYIFKKILIIAHPLIPYITEIIWDMFNDKNLLINEEWPSIYNENSLNEAEENFDKIIDMIQEIRKYKIKNHIKSLKNIIIDDNILIKQNFEIINNLAGVEKFSIINPLLNIKNTSNNVTLLNSKIGNFYVENISYNNEAELFRLNNEKEKLEKEIIFLKTKMSNNIFLSKAPAKLVNKFKNKLKITLQLLAKINFEIITINSSVKK